MIIPIKLSTISFTYKSPLKTEWKKGKMPSVKYDVFGDKLTKDNVTLDHAQARIRGGKTNLGNLTLMTKENNVKKGSVSLKDIATKEQIKNYLKQFENVISKDFDGNHYISLWKKNIKRWFK